MLSPLIQFHCDTCGEVIEKPEEGWFEWISEYDEEAKITKSHSFRIVHNRTHSPLANYRKTGCYQHDAEEGRLGEHLNYFLSEDNKMAIILKFLDIGPIHTPIFKEANVADIREYVEIVRRLTIPYYEEARLYWKEAEEDGYFSGANEIWVYGVRNLKNLIEQYGEK